jgi:hypothetical protein
LLNQAAGGSCRASDGAAVSSDGLILQRVVATPKPVSMAPVSIDQPRLSVSVA